MNWIQVTTVPFKEKVLIDVDKIAYIKARGMIAIL